MPTQSCDRFKRFDATIGNDAVQTVNARDLHTFLEVGKDFSNWIKDRITAYSFTENVDFVVSANSGENPQGGRPAKDYHLSLDMAKELAMVERNERGKQARQYCIECERRLRENPDPFGGFKVPHYLNKALPREPNRKGQPHDSD